MTPLRKAVKHGPRTVETLAIWDARHAELGIDAAKLSSITEAFDAERARSAKAAKRYYDGHHRLVIAGVPIRCAAFAKTLRNKAILYR